MGRRALLAAIAALVACGRIGFGALGGDGSAGRDGDLVSDGGALDGSAGLSPNLAFVTSTTRRPGELGSVAGADDLCATLATAAGRPGTYVAFLSSSTMDARTRLGRASGWVRIDGRPVAASLDELAAGRMLMPLQIDETGAAVGSFAPVATASAADGTLVGGTCGDYSALSGTVGGGQAAWTGFGFTAPAFGLTCNTANRLFCFGVDRTGTVTVTPEDGRRAFVTDGLWTPGGGLASADTLCATEAMDAGLTGSYLALLATPSETAASRFDRGGDAWVRLDGLRLAASADLFMTAGPDAPLNVTPSRQYLASESLRTFGGGNSPIEVGATSDASCNGWTTTVGTRVADVGRPVAAGLASFRDDLANCGDSLPVYCLEE